MRTPWWKLLLLGWMPSYIEQETRKQQQYRRLRLLYPLRQPPKQPHRSKR